MRNIFKTAFTLSELLIAVGIIGIISAIAVPAMLTNIQRQQQTTQLKSLISSIQQIAANQMILNHTKNLADTDFSLPDKILSDKYFTVVKKCDSSSSKTDCWKSKEGTYNTIKKHTAVSGGVLKSTIVLKNGTILSYYKAPAGMADFVGKDEKPFGVFVVDVSGTDKPNLFCRDYFAFYISDKGKVYGTLNPNNTYTKEDALSTTDTGVCVQYIMNNGWKMDY